MVYQHVNFERVSIILTKNVVINGVEDVRLIEETVDPKAVSAKECLIESEVSLISAGTELSRVFGLKKGAVYPVVCSSMIQVKVMEEFFSSYERKLAQSKALF